MRLQRLLLLLSCACLTATAAAQSDEIRVPDDAVAGAATLISVNGSGSATFYLIGPNTSLKRNVKFGKQIQLTAHDTQAAGRYLVIVCADTCRSAGFLVHPAKVSSMTFLAHPSRAPVGQGDIISGVALPFDEFHNLVLAPENVQFELTSAGKTLMSRQEPTQNGVAWFRTSSGRSAGAVQMTASVNDLVTRKVVQQVASDPCNLRIKGQRTAKGIVVETDPVRDCAGNPVPDGTIVTFTAKNGSQTSTVDAPVKKDVARAEIIANGDVVISAASGVVMGNELRIGGQ